jgi:uncharacterized membrane protein YbhN (UPF0104 family)
MTGSEGRPSIRSARWSRMIVRAALSCALLIWVLHSTALAPMWTALSRAAWPPLVGGFALALLARLAAAERNQAVSRSLGLDLSRWQSIEALFISNFYALVSP